jgi:hypothetical protein
MPPDPRELLKTLPPRVDRRIGAELVTRHIIPTTHRAIETWPLVRRYVGGRALYETAALFEHAHAMLDAAPPVRGGRRRRAADAQVAA